MNLGKAFDGAVAFGRSEQSGNANGQQFPKSAEAPPHAKWYAQVCKDGQSAAFKPDENTWSDETWQQLNFSISDPFRYKYTFESQGAGPGASFTIRATGDLDCDGVFSTFERMGTLNADGEVEGASGIFINQELE